MLENRALRRSFGLKRVEGELHNFYFSLNRVCDMEARDGICRSVFVVKPKWQRPLGKPACIYMS
jgi:hypothetical protein